MYRIARFPGVPESPGAARRMVRDALGREHPKVSDAELIVSELATNAVLHSLAGEDGFFWVEIAQRGDRLWIEVFDGGMPDEDRPCRSRERRATTGAGSIS
ncbi:ATP-binding protein [Kitasatospora sp. HPMI-4]|uniref:ATP-binding protein n=1 Tax=Kitasatospora sp. HPMI-4 TaxID=3448443 RepID=UPI003F1B9BA8